MSFLTARNGNELLLYSLDPDSVVLNVKRKERLVPVKYEQRAPRLDLVCSMMRERSAFGVATLNERQHTAQRPVGEVAVQQQLAEMADLTEVAVPDSEEALVS